MRGICALTSATGFLVLNTGGSVVQIAHECSVSMGALRVGGLLLIGFVDCVIAVVISTAIFR